MELRDLLTDVESKVKIARINFDLGFFGVCRDHLGFLFDVLDDEVGSGARDKCESAESSLSHREIDVVDLQEGDKDHDL